MEPMKARCIAIVSAAVECGAPWLAAAIIADASVTPEAAQRIFTRVTSSMRRGSRLAEVMAAERIPNPGSEIAGPELGGMGDLVARAKAVYNAAVGR